MHFLYIYYISQHSYMFRSIWTILRELYSKKVKVHSLEVVIYIRMKMHGKHSIRIYPIICL
jgi:hypothetical protein